MLHLVALRGVARALSCAGLCFAVFCALLLAGCQTDKPGIASAVQPRGATVAFDSIEGLPPDEFRTLVSDLNQEAQARQLAVVPRAQAAAYRVRGYFATAVEKGRTTLSWVFDVFDSAERRALRISGNAPMEGAGGTAADPNLMQQIARGSMDELAGFLTSSAVASGGEPNSRLALAADGSPETAGIFQVAPTDLVASRTTGRR